MVVVVFAERCGILIFQVSHYSLRFHSSDADIMSDPVPSIRHQGIVQQSTEGEDIQHLMH